MPDSSNPQRDSELTSTVAHVVPFSFTDGSDAWSVHSAWIGAQRWDRCIARGSVHSASAWIGARRVRRVTSRGVSNRIANNDSKEPQEIFQNYAFFVFFGS